MMRPITFDTVRYFLDNASRRPWRVEHGDEGAFLVSALGSPIKSDLDLHIASMLVNEIVPWMNGGDRLDGMYRLKDDIAKAIDTLIHLSNISDNVNNVAFIEPHGREYIKIYWSNGSTTIQKMSSVDRWFMDFIEQLKATRPAVDPEKPQDEQQTIPWIWPEEPQPQMIDPNSTAQPVVHPTTTVWCGLDIDGNKIA